MINEFVFLELFRLQTFLARGPVGVPKEGENGPLETHSHRT
jgi:hypothetical protein